MIARLAPLFGYVASALLLSSAAELGAMLVLRDLFEEEFGIKGVRAVLLVPWMPFAVFFAAAFTESLYLLLSHLVFYCLRSGWLLRASLCVALAALTRQDGILLLIPLVFAYQKSLRYWIALAIPVAALATFWGAVSWWLRMPFAPMAAEGPLYDRKLQWPSWGIGTIL